MTMRMTICLACAIGLAIASVVGCKRGAGSSSTAAGNGSAAAGAGAVSVQGNIAVFQNVHVQVPWNLSDPAAMVTAASEAAAGRGLKLTDGKTTLQIASDGRSLRLNGTDRGPLQPGDRVVLTKEGTLTVNGAERSANGPATFPSG